MKVLLHICCAPCAITPLDQLREDKFEVMGFFYRHNIHPYSECLRREETLREWAETMQLRVVYQKDYKMEKFIQNVVFREADRCNYCYYDRLRATALVAKRGKFDYFSTTLLYSKFQKHEQIKTIALSVAKTIGIKFYYADFRTGWKKGITASKKLNLYRQQYCGCIYSEMDRFYQKQD